MKSFFFFLVIVGAAVAAIAILGPKYLNANGGCVKTASGHCAETEFGP